MLLQRRARRSRADDYSSSSSDASSLDGIVRYNALPPIDAPPSSPQSNKKHQETSKLQYSTYKKSMKREPKKRMIKMWVEVNNPNKAKAKAKASNAVDSAAVLALKGAAGDGEISEDRLVDNESAVGFMGNGKNGSDCGKAGTAVDSAAVLALKGAAGDESNVQAVGFPGRGLGRLFDSGFLGVDRGRTRGFRGNHRGLDREFLGNRRGRTGGFFGDGTGRTRGFLAEGRGYGRGFLAEGRGFLRDGRGFGGCILGHGSGFGQCFGTDLGRGSGRRSAGRGSGRRSLGRGVGGNLVAGRGTGGELAAGRGVRKWSFGAYVCICS